MWSFDIFYVVSFKKWWTNRRVTGEMRRLNAHVMSLYRVWGSILSVKQERICQNAMGKTFLTHNTFCVYIMLFCRCPGRTSTRWNECLGWGVFKWFILILPYANQITCKLNIICPEIFEISIEITSTGSITDSMNIYLCITSNFPSQWHSIRPKSLSRSLLAGRLVPHPLRRTMPRDAHKCEMLLRRLNATSQYLDCYSCQGQSTI